MKKITLLLGFLLLIPFAIPSNSVDLLWEIHADTSVNEVNGFYLFYSQDKEYYIPRFQTEEICYVNPNCVFIKRNSNSQTQFYYNLENLDYTRYYMWLYPSNPNSLLLGPQIQFSQSVNFRIPATELPVELFWRLDPNSYHDQIDSFFIFYSDRAYFNPDKFISKDDCINLEDCIFVDRVDKTQINFTYTLDIISSDEKYIFIYPSEFGSNSLGRPLFFITRKIIIEDLDDDVLDDNSFTDLELTYLEISKLYKELSNVQKSINNGDHSSDIINLRSKFYNDLKKLGQENVLEKEGMPLTYVELWELRSLQFYNYVFPDTEFETNIKEKISNLISVQKRIDDKSIEVNDFANKFDSIISLYDEGLTPYPSLPDEYETYLDFWIAIVNSNSEDDINKLNYFSQEIETYKHYIEISILYEQLSNIQYLINQGDYLDEHLTQKQNIIFELENRGENSIWDKGNLNFNYDIIWKLKSQKYFPFDSTYVPIERPLKPVVIEKLEQEEEFDYDQIFDSNLQNLIWPVDLSKVVISSCYGWRRLSSDKPFTWHDGIDIALGEGTEILATADGVVYQACDTNCNTRGHHLTLYHSHLKTYSQYNHLSELKVELNDEVKQGDIIALSGNTGDSTGPHLDFKYYFSSNMRSRTSNPIGNPLCYLPPLPPTSQYYKTNLKTYFSTNAHSCRLGRIKSSTSGGDTYGAISKCPNINSINYQQFLIPSIELVDEEKTDKTIVFEKNRDIEKVLKVMEFAKDHDLLGKKCHCNNHCRDYLEVINESSNEGIDLLFVLSLMMQESTCQSEAVSSSSIGLMQINAEVWKGNHGLPNDVVEATKILKENYEVNIKAGVAILEEYFKRAPVNFRGCNFTSHTNLNEKYGLVPYKKVSYTGWEAALRRYNGLGCNRNYPIQDYYVHEIIDRFSQLKQLYDNSDNLDDFRSPICGTNIPGKKGQDLSNRECKPNVPHFDCWGYAVYTDYSSQACPGNQVCCLK